MKKLLTVVAVLAGCGVEFGERERIVTAQEPVIVGSLDWVEASTLSGTLAREARKVGIMPIPGTSHRCNAFLVTRDLVMANNHCVPNGSAARGIRVGFDYNGSSANWYDCSQFVYTWSESREDMTLLRCYPKDGKLPGDVYGWVTAGSDPAPGTSVYMIHHNCDYLRQPGCAPTKKMSPGKVAAQRSPGYYEVTYTADSLPYSSGGAVFDANGRLVALHHKGLPEPYGTNGDGYGYGNAGIRIEALIRAVQ